MCMDVGAAPIPRLGGGCLGEATGVPEPDSKNRANDLNGKALVRVTTAKEFAQDLQS
jgi:hypothetical protein